MRNKRDPDRSRGERDSGERTIYTSPIKTTPRTVFHTTVEESEDPQQNPSSQCSGHVRRP